MKKIVSAAFAVSLFVLSFNVAAQNTTTSKVYSFDNLPVVATTSFKKDTISILKYGAKSDGLT